VISLPTPPPFLPTRQPRYNGDMDEKPPRQTKGAMLIGCGLVLAPAIIGLFVGAALVWINPPPPDPSQGKLLKMLLDVAGGAAWGLGIGGAAGFIIVWCGAIAWRIRLGVWPPNRG
jgi:hypothetical protein